jgi:hypothetical protein
MTLESAAIPFKPFPFRPSQLPQALSDYLFTETQPKIKGYRRKARHAACSPTLPDCLLSMDETHAA